MVSFGVFDRSIDRLDLYLDHSLEQCLDCQLSIIIAIDLLAIRLCKTSSLLNFLIIPDDEHCHDQTH